MTPSQFTPRTAETRERLTGWRYATTASVSCAQYVASRVGTTAANSVSTAVATTISTIGSHGTAGATSVGDCHDGGIATVTTRHGGRIVKTTGDGVLATLPSADAALRAAVAIRSLLAQHDLVVRIGVHIGDVEWRGDDVAGITVNAAERVMALAEPGDILATSAVEAADRDNALSNGFRTHGQGMRTSTYA